MRGGGYHHVTLSPQSQSVRGKRVVDIIATPMIQRTESLKTPLRSIAYVIQCKKSHLGSDRDLAGWEDLEADIFGGDEISGRIQSSISERIISLRLTTFGRGERLISANDRLIWVRFWRFEGVRNLRIMPSSPLRERSLYPYSSQIQSTASIQS